MNRTSMELDLLSEEQRDLICFGIAQACDSARDLGNKLPFVVTDGEGGRELTWLDGVAQAYDLDPRERRIVVCHDLLELGSAGKPTPAIVVEWSSAADAAASVLVIQQYRSSGSQRGFQPLGRPFLSQALAVS